MPVLIWDKVGERVYEAGLDKGVLYLPDGSAVPWNGLVSVIEGFDKSVSPVYYDGMKINDSVTFGDFSATVKAVTYPEEFNEIEGLGQVKRGLFYADQPPKSFGLCYRAKIGNDVEGDSVGHKIHILYNLTAIPKEKTYASLSLDPSLIEFEWEITAVPEEIPGFRPTGHIIIDSRKIDPWLLEELEEKLYGGTIAVASLIPMNELVTFISEWYRVKIIDNGDGTWTAISMRDGFISLDVVNDLFTITHVNAVYLNATTYQISDTLDVSDVPQISITDNGDGTWSASTDQDGLIIMLDADTFEILNANAVSLGPNSYLISDTLENG